MSAAQGEELSPADAFTLAVAEELRVQMVRKQVTGRELARRLAVSSQWVSQRTRGVVPMDTRDLAAAAHALEIPVGDLLAEAVRKVAEDEEVGGMRINPGGHETARHLTLVGEAA